MKFVNERKQFVSHPVGGAFRTRFSLFREVVKLQQKQSILLTG
jgi:hypothetical protein